MRTIPLVLGAIVLLMGVAWALQGAYLLPATFMRGPTWIGIGAAVAVVGFLIAFFGARRGTPSKQD